MIEPNKALANRLADKLRYRLPDPPPRAVLLGCVYNLMDALIDYVPGDGGRSFALSVKAGAAELLDQEVP